MRPEEVLSLPLIVDGGSRPSLVAKRTVHNATGDAVAVSYENDDAAALVAMCNAYPLALALAEACERYMDNGGLPEYANAREALAAFLAHRTETEAKP